MVLHWGVKKAALGSAAFSPVEVAVRPVDSALLKCHAAADPDLFKDNGQRTETGEGRLKQIGPHKGGEKQPIDAVDLGKDNGQQDHGSCEGQYDAIDGHD
jgi:hypothetical protein